MFDAMYEEKKNQKARIKYYKDLGWNEFDSDGDKVPVAIFVYDVEMGYACFRQGQDGKELVFHSLDLDEAVEWGVDRARREIADHEIKQQERQAKEND